MLKPDQVAVAGPAHRGVGRHPRDKPSRSQHRSQCSTSSTGTRDPGRKSVPMVCATGITAAWSGVELLCRSHAASASGSMSEPLAGLYPAAPPLPFS
jgi:hypothetical protein